MTGFGAAVAPTVKPRTPRKHPLAGNGPIVDRARQALRFTAEQFGEVTGADQTTVSVRTADGLDLALSYEPGNYVFSRVYALTVSTQLPASTAIPRGVKLVHRGPQRGGTFVADRGSLPDSRAVARLNAITAEHLGTIDMVRASIAQTGQRTLTLSPMGGAYVWVMIPPVFKATAFPPGEPERILALIRAVRELDPAPSPSPSA
ncbi:hypothetical protein [Leucobacter luti]|uniref:Uncharacterized protein n=1 Tax=Leucobacter luti TaxID=340320 RepID=A0A4R6RWQ3_9MICO|nr:hypothetical protein [Leucobacter luti]QYM75830.1 hypothetical protein K1X41_14715 [Leucobacter luti]TDP91460.1 hypothetical protein EDF62_2076 [Leucobacter luti]